jgi:hypothetical protein
VKIEGVGSSLSLIERFASSLCSARFESTHNVSAEGRNLAGLETGTVSRKISIINIRSSLPIGNPEGLNNSLGSMRILPEERDSWMLARY